MVSPREYYKSAHPASFSDSSPRETTELDRSLLEFQLSSLTSRSQEADFERFARRLCEKEVCPNLLPTTGPTGGGDSKADSETFPVADSLALTWYGGVAREASGERWAFAFSAKADWRPKVQSDVQKIAATARGYAKAFFVTNQSVPAKARAAVEDGLSKQYGIDVRILDRTWILDRVFSGRHENIAIDELKVAALTRSQVQTGPADAARLAELDATEARIVDAVSSGRLGPPLVDEALSAAGLCRSLEKPRIAVEGAYARADRLAMAHGTERQQVESAYQWAWTLFWWFEDVKAVISQYAVVEERAKDSRNTYDLERQMNLWTVLFTRVVPRGEAGRVNEAGGHTAVLEAALKRVEQEKDRPSASLQAESMLLQVELVKRLHADADPDTVFERMRNVLERAEGLVGFPLDTLVKCLTVVGDRVEDSEAYDSLFQEMVEVQSRREGEVRAARLLLTRGEQLLEKRKLTRAIALVGQALGRLYKHETRKEIVYGLYLCGQAYERIGLVWAARGAYLSGASIAVNDFWKYGTVSVGFAACVNRLKWAEARLGRLPHLLEWHGLDLAVRASRSGRDAEAEAEEDAGFDMVVAFLILKVPPERHAELGGLTSALDRLGLYLAASAALFLLGYPERLEEYAKDSDTDSDGLANEISSMDTDVALGDSAALSGDGHAVLSTKILGCEVTVSAAPERPCIEVGEGILSTLESLLATIATEQGTAFEPELTIEITPGELSGAFVDVVEQERLGRPHFAIRCQTLEPRQVSPGDHGRLQHEIFQACLHIFPHAIRFRDPERDLTALFKEERVAERASAFTGSFVAVRNVLGDSPKFAVKDWADPDAPRLGMVRVEPWTPAYAPAKGAGDHGEWRELRAADEEAPPGLFDRSQLSHEDMAVLSPIRLRLWDRVQWCGTMFLTVPGSDAHPPALGIVFRNEQAGHDIFAAWRSELGEADEKGVLRLTIVRGIDRSHPYAYRVMVGGNPGMENDPTKVFTMVSRINRMDAATSLNLNRFLDSYDVHRRFWLMPTFMEGNEPILEHEVGIEITSLNVRNAWEIGMNDIDCAGVLPDDEVIVPEGVASPPVLRLQQWKRERGVG